MTHARKVLSSINSRIGMEIAHNGHDHDHTQWVMKAVMSQSVVHIHIHGPGVAIYIFIRKSTNVSVILVCDRFLQ